MSSSTSPSTPLIKARGVSSCTTTIVTKGASADGSVLVSHSNDNHLADQSIVYVPAKDWPEGSKRPVHPSAVAIGPVEGYNAKIVPRLVCKERAPGYDFPDEEPTEPVGFIPQVPHTYAYLDGNYGIINEHGLMFGECTDGAFISNGPSPDRLFYSTELSRVALERCKTAREAIQLMGDLLEEYGYYGTGETLPVADASEAWVMEMAPSHDGKSGLWVAQQVPDGEFFVAGNEFRIREIYENQGPGLPVQMYGKKLFAKIKEAGWRFPKEEDKPMDWLSSVSNGEYSHPYYSLRRVWRAFSLAAPTLQLPAWVDPAEGGKTRAYPFSIKPDKKLTLDDLKRIHRDHYEGTEFDLTKGVAAGPFGNPNRYLGPADPSDDVGDPDKLKGAWERPISMFYIGYTFINQLRPDLPSPINAVCWMALNTPAESVFVPLAVAPMPEGYEKCDTRRYAPEAAWWTYNLIGEYANLKYSYMIKDIQALYGKNEAAAEALVRRKQKEVAELVKNDPAKALEIFSKSLRINAEFIREEWRKLFGELVFKYNQGYLNTHEKQARKIGYPQEWLERTNYHNGPIRY